MLADLRFALRLLAKSPSFTLVAVFTLALGIATATTMFTFFDAVLLRPLPFFADEDTLLVIRTVNAKDPEHDFEFSMPDFYDLRAQSRTLAGVLTNENRTYILNGGERPKRVFGTWTTVDGFQTLGVRPIRGRLFRPDEAKPGAAPVVLLGYSLWKESFGGREDILGEQIMLNNGAATVIGVMPENFRFPDANELWQPYPDNERTEEKHRGDHGTQVYARMQPGITLERVQAELDAIAAQLAKAHPITNTGLGFRALTARDEATRDVHLALRLMLGAVLAVLLIACANVTNLLLARGATRSREIAVRLALGAGRGRIVRQVLTESLLLGALGGLAGLVLSFWELYFVLGFIPEIPYWLRFDIDWRVATFITATTVGASVIFGTFPALQISRPDLAQELKDGSRGGTGSGRAHRLRSALVVLQLAFALILLVLGGLTMRSFLKLQRTDTGINAGHVLTFRTGLPPAIVPDEKVALEFFEKVGVQLRALPGVESAGFISYLPVSNSRDRNTFLVEDMPEPHSNQEWPQTLSRSATPGAFAALQVPLLQGRLFDEHDRGDTPRVAVVDQNFAKRFFPRGTALGRRITFDDPGPKRTWLTIVGIVGNISQRPADPEQDPAVWMSLAQHPDNFASAVVRVQGDPAGYIRAVADAVLAVRPDIPIYNADPLSRVVHNTLWKQRMFGSLFAGFAAIALFLAAIGIYGVMSYTVSQRTQEIGVRMALGAQPGAVIAMMLRHGVRLVAFGLVFGFIGAWFVAMTLTGLLHGIEPHDPPTFAFVPLLLALVALLACYLPSRRATLVDPITALRAE
jgi:putative ABC transport system permease protein